MIFFSAVPRLKFDNEVTMSKAHGRFEADANKAVAAFKLDSGLLAIKAKCPKDN